MSASICLGQVYEAETLDGAKVAVKVQRPDVEAVAALDLYILRAYSRTLTGLVRAHTHAHACMWWLHIGTLSNPLHSPETCRALARSEEPRAFVHGGDTPSRPSDRRPCMLCALPCARPARARHACMQIKLLGRELDLVSVIDDFGHLLYAEMDYRCVSLLTAP